MILLIVALHLSIVSAISNFDVFVLNYNSLHENKTPLENYIQNSTQYDKNLCDFHNICSVKENFNFSNIFPHTVKNMVFPYYTLLPAEKLSAFFKITDKIADNWLRIYAKNLWKIVKEDQQFVPFNMLYISPNYTNRADYNETSDCFDKKFVSSLDVTVFEELARICEQINLFLNHKNLQTVKASSEIITRLFLSVYNNSFMIINFNKSKWHFDENTQHWTYVGEKAVKNTTNVFPNFKIVHNFCEKAINDCKILRVESESCAAKTTVGSTVVTAALGCGAGGAMGTFIFPVIGSAMGCVGGIFVGSITSIIGLPLIVEKICL